MYTPSFTRSECLSTSFISLALFARSISLIAASISALFIVQFPYGKLTTKKFVEVFWRLNASEAAIERYDDVKN